MLMEKETYEATMKEQKEIIKKVKTDFKKQGKKNRASGARFERKVRADLETKGWIVIKNPNNVIDGKFKQGKSKYNPFTKTLMMNSGGFPDFIAYQKGTDEEKVSTLFLMKTEPNKQSYYLQAYTIIGIECKINGTLSKEEKEKCRWLLNEKIFSKIFVVSKGEKRGEINYKEILNE